MELDNFSTGAGKGQTRVAGGPWAHPGVRLSKIDQGTLSRGKVWKGKTIGDFTYQERVKVGFNL